jgi:transcriptional regulator with GAF, ATPase, and Fis domain
MALNERGAIANGVAVKLLIGEPCAAARPALQSNEMVRMANAPKVAVRSREAECQIEPIGASSRLLDLFQFAKRIAASDAKVMTTGESGVGKEVLARHIHAHSARRGRECITVNCAAVSESLLESELFGHVKGGFTGSCGDKPGSLRMAHLGTLFLDEVGEMSARMQGLLLRFLENGEIQAVGADLPIRVDVRIIAATNRDLTAMTAAGQFRQDLLYRLRIMHLHVPPLREWAEDVRVLGCHFLTLLGHNLALTDTAWATLARYPWPGNVRELRNVMEGLAFRSPGRCIDADNLPERFRHEPQEVGPQYERRRQLADALYEAIVEDGYSFWDHVAAMFLNRDITRRELRELVGRGLAVTMGNYRALVGLFSMPASDYKRFMNFLTTHDCRPAYREYRNVRSFLNPPPPAPRRPLLSDQRRAGGRPADRPVGATITSDRNAP